MANIPTPEETAKIKELEATLDFLKVQKKEPLKQDETPRKPGELSAVDRARASRFAPPTYMTSSNAVPLRSAAPAEKEEPKAEPAPEPWLGQVPRIHS